ncbi:MAG: hypothetical protein KAR44_02850 [Candidatus Aegiribacteria sp.]|nr:hypothetical protein [Candidatus Aegiribacteria sp.]
MVLPLLLILVAGVEGEDTLYIDHAHAITYLSDCLRLDEAYEDGVLETVSFMIEWLDDLPDSTVRDYTDIAIRELFDPGEPVADDSLPLLDRFRVYKDGRILYSSPIQGFLIPYEDFLRGITNI